MLSLPDALPISSAYLGQPVRNAPMRRNAWRPQNSFDSSSRTEPDRAPVTGYEMHMGETRGPGTARAFAVLEDGKRSEEHTSELQSLMRISYAVFCLKKKTYYIRQILSNK